MEREGVRLGRDAEHRPRHGQLLDGQFAGNDEFRGRLGERAGGDQVAEDILRPIELRRWRADQRTRQHGNVMAAAWAEHHAMRLEHDRTRVAVGRPVVDRQLHSCRRKAVGRAVNPERILMQVQGLAEVARRDGQCSFSTIVAALHKMVRQRDMNLRT